MQARAGGADRELVEEGGAAVETADPLSDRGRGQGAEDEAGRRGRANVRAAAGGDRVAESPVSRPPATPIRQNQTSATMNALVSAFTTATVPRLMTWTRTRGATAAQMNPAGIPQTAVATAATRPIPAARGQPREAAGSGGRPDGADRAPGSGSPAASGMCVVSTGQF